MRYIRTKDGKVRKSKDFAADELWNYENETDNILKQADTIEELCDEFVVIRNNDKYVCDYIGEEPYYLAIEHDGDGHYFSKKELLDLIVYGAIWTDKGLIYVAKMNDKGELELL